MRGESQFDVMAISLHIKKNCYWSVVDESYGYKIDDLYRKPVYIYKVGYDYFADINVAP